MQFKDEYILGKGIPFIIPEVAQLFTYKNGKAILVKLKQPDFMIWSGKMPEYELILRKIK